MTNRFVSHQRSPCVILSASANQTHEIDEDPRVYLAMAGLTAFAIALYLSLYYGAGIREHWVQWPLFLNLLVAGVPTLWELSRKLLRGQFGSDLLAGISIVTSIILGEYLAACIVVLMFSGGEAIEHYAMANATAVLRALARRMPTLAHRDVAGKLVDVPVANIVLDDVLLVFPHEICPVDGIVVEGHGSMDESFLTGEPYRMSKVPGVTVISGALNGDVLLKIRATRLPKDSRYAQIMKVMEQSQQQSPAMRRLGDQLGAWYTPFVLLLALLAWAFTQDARRFLSVIVIATPCPMLLAIPIAIMGAISLSARRGIIIKNPAVLERFDRCRTYIFDKTGTLTYGKPILTELLPQPGFEAAEVLRHAAALERYSKHPLAQAILDAAEAQRLAPLAVKDISELPGEGLRGDIEGDFVRITSRKKLAQAGISVAELPPITGGLECVVQVGEKIAGVIRFRDEPRLDGKAFIQHLSKHHVHRVMLVSGDRASEVAYLAEKVGITTIRAEQSPEDKLRIVREEVDRAPTAFLGDGINDAPALHAATVGIAFGAASDITSEAADAVILESSLQKVDELLHISQRMRRIALESAVGGMALSLIGIGFAIAGYIPPIGGALSQEIIDLLAVLNAVRASWPPRIMSDINAN